MPIMIYLSTVEKLLVVVVVGIGLISGLVASAPQLVTATSL
jgi:hypothetical protein